jgi:hypothetical protein
VWGAVRLTCCSSWLVYVNRSCLTRSARCSRPSHSSVKAPMPKVARVSRFSRPGDSSPPLAIARFADTSVSPILTASNRSRSRSSRNSRPASSTSWSRLRLARRDSTSARSTRSSATTPQRARSAWCVRYTSRPYRCLTVALTCPSTGAQPDQLQRVGRTGRKREGSIFVLMGEGREEDAWNKAKDNYISGRSPVCFRHQECRGGHYD